MLKNREGDSEIQCKACDLNVTWVKNKTEDNTANRVSCTLVPTLKFYTAF